MSSGGSMVSAVKVVGAAKVVGAEPLIKALKGAFIPVSQFAKSQRN